MALFLLMKHRRLNERQKSRAALLWSKDVREPEGKRRRRFCLLPAPSPEVAPAGRLGGNWKAEAPPPAAKSERIQPFLVTEFEEALHLKSSPVLI